MAYLVGSIGDIRDELQIYQVKIVGSISKDDLAISKSDDYYQIINLKNETYFNPEKNEWIKIKQG